MNAVFRWYFDSTIVFTKALVWLFRKRNSWKILESFSSIDSVFPFRITWNVFRALCSREQTVGKIQKKCQHVTSSEPSMPGQEKRNGIQCFYHRTEKGHSCSPKATLLLIQKYNEYEKLFRYVNYTLAFYSNQKTRFIDFAIFWVFQKNPENFLFPE